MYCIIGIQRIQQGTTGRKFLNSAILAIASVPIETAIIGYPDITLTVGRQTDWIIYPICNGIK